MIDLHTHILPGIDDGARSVHEALNMTEMLLKQNIQKAVCTPHFDPTKISLQDFIIKRSASKKLMQGSKLTLLSGSETLFHQYLFHYPDLKELCIENTRYLLLELPFASKWEEDLYANLEKLIYYYSIIPIIAHIERYPVVKKNMKCIHKLVELGCILQLNTSSLIDKSSRKQAIKFLKHGYIDVLGSDCHNMEKRPPVFTEALSVITKKLGMECCNKLQMNAMQIVNGVELGKKRKIYLIE